MRILSLDTSNQSSSVSVLENKKVIAKIFLNCGLIHSKIISHMVKDLLDLSGIDINTIDLLAVCTGPGSFTGIRIGMSFMKGMALATKKICIGVSSLKSLAYSVAPISEDKVIFSCIKANKDEIYFNSYDYLLHENFEDRFIKISDVSSFVEKEEKKIVFVGNAAEICYSIASEVKRVGFEFFDKEVDAEFIGQAAFDLHNEGCSLLKANYLKKTRAEVSKNV